MLCVWLSAKLDVSLANDWFKLDFFRISSGQIGLVANFWFEMRHVNLSFDFWLVVADLG